MAWEVVELFACLAVLGGAGLIAVIGLSHIIANLHTLAQLA